MCLTGCVWLGSLCGCVTKINSLSNALCKCGYLWCVCVGFTNVQSRGLVIFEVVPMHGYPDR